GRLEPPTPAAARMRGRPASMATARHGDQRRKARARTCATTRTVHRRATDGSPSPRSLSVRPMGLGRLDSVTDDERVLDGRYRLRPRLGGGAGAGGYPADHRRPAPPGGG